MRKLKRLLKKRGIEIKIDRKLHREYIRKNIVCNKTVGWYNWNEPNIIFLVKGILFYKSKDIIKTILHEYRHWIQFHRKESIFITCFESEYDACEYAERARKYF